MYSISSSELTDRIVKKAKSLGAVIAGVANVKSLKVSPSQQIYPKIGMNLLVHWQDVKDDDKPDEVAWPADAVSAIVIGVEHNINNPELDWWDGKGTSGNRILIRINNKLSEWVENTFPIKTYKLPNYCVKYCRRCELACPVGK
jgi:epoxyqueuosine reductase